MKPPATAVTTKKVAEDTKKSVKVHAMEPDGECRPMVHSGFDWPLSGKPPPAYTEQLLATEYASHS